MAQLAGLKEAQDSLPEPARTIARTIADCHRLCRDDDDTEIIDRIVTTSFADMLRAGDPNFDRLRFIAACGP